MCAPKESSDEVPLKNNAIDYGFCSFPNTHFLFFEAMTWGDHILADTQSSDCLYSSCSFIGIPFYSKLDASALAQMPLPVNSL